MPTINGLAGRTVVQGLAFDWICCDGNCLRVSHGTYGQRLEPLHFRVPEAVAQLVAISMICDGPSAPQDPVDPARST